MNKQIFISDTHFGVRNNSITWLESQKAFIYDQLIPYLKKIKDDRVTVIHLGDVFDSRSSISPMICMEADKIFQEISKYCDELIVIAGNHDFYSPIENDNNFTSLKMLPCYWQDGNVCIFADTEYSHALNSNGISNVFIPWFRFHNPTSLKEIIDKYDPVNIFTHTDVDHLDKEIQELVNGRNIISGHIHIPLIEPNKKHWTLGSCFPLNYADADSARGFYETTDWDMSTIKFIENTKSIKFHRITNEQVLTYSEYSQQDYIELTIKDTLYEREDIQKAIKEFYNTCYHFTVTIEQEDIEIESVDQDLGIYNIVKKSCPEHLHPKLETIADN